MIVFHLSCSKEYLSNQKCFHFMRFHLSQTGNRVRFIWPPLHTQLHTKTVSKMSIKLKDDYFRLIKRIFKLKANFHKTDALDIKTSHLYDIGIFSNPNAKYVDDDLAYHLTDAKKSFEKLIYYLSVNQSYFPVTDIEIHPLLDAPEDFFTFDERRTAYMLYLSEKSITEITNRDEKNPIELKNSIIFSLLDRMHHQVLLRFISGRRYWFLPYSRIVRGLSHLLLQEFEMAKEVLPSHFRVILNLAEVNETNASEEISDEMDLKNLETEITDLDRAAESLFDQSFVSISTVKGSSMGSPINKERNGIDMLIFVFFIFYHFRCNFPDMETRMPTASENLEDFENKTNISDQMKNGLKFDQPLPENIYRHKLDHLMPYYSFLYHIHDQFSNNISLIFTIDMIKLMKRFGCHLKKRKLLAFGLIRRVPGLRDRLILENDDLDFTIAISSTEQSQVQKQEQRDNFKFKITLEGVKCKIFALNIMKMKILTDYDKHYHVFVNSKKINISDECKSQNSDITTFNFSILLERDSLLDLIIKSVENDILYKKCMFIDIEEKEPVNQDSVERKRPDNLLEMYFENVYKNLNVKHKRIESDPLAKNLRRCLKKHQLLLFHQFKDVIHYERIEMCVNDFLDFRSRYSYEIYR
ncbi:hypothetical protein M153_1190004841 [Pseudoloma neurophilia]|uniref:Uncharacterized protein n=1 Tax=Pseudoloma neurophilia TaxID=146866 RepID=A0A0R0M045_9MICR|nr:hypothetical protein M153_1190004841 [Pseudoloma neurophilia]